MPAFAGPFSKLRAIFGTSFVRVARDRPGRWPRRSIPGLVGSCPGDYLCFGEAFLKLEMGRELTVAETILTVRPVLFGQRYAEISVGIAAFALRLRRAARRGCRLDRPAGAIQSNACRAEIRNSAPSALPGNFDCAARSALPLVADSVEEVQGC
jgi:hypothetical protein